METSATPTYIYTLSDPRTGVIRYVGKSNDPAQRYRRHLKNARDGHHFHTPTWIRSLLAEGLKPQLAILETCSQQDWRDRETYWIAYYRAEGCDLTNCKDGGDGLNVTDEIRAKMRAAKLGKTPSNKGKRASAEVRQKQSEAAKRRVERDPEANRRSLMKATEVSRSTRRGQPGRKKSPEEIQKIKQKLKGRKLTVGYKLTDEQRRQRSERMRGHIVSDETRRKLSEARRRTVLAKQRDTNRGDRRTED